MRTALVLASVALAFGCRGEDAGSVAAPTAASTTGAWHDALEALSERWVPVRRHDARREVLEVRDGRLVLGLDTLGSDDRTVKAIGLRTARPIDFTRGARIAIGFDWGTQTNVSYLAAGVFLAPEASEGDVKEEEDWLAVQLVGVPPGQAARPQVGARSKGRMIELATFGWPAKKPIRSLGKEQIVLELRKSSLRVEFDGESFATNEAPISFERAFLYLQFHGHSNYPLREVFFEDVAVSPLP